MLAVRGKLDTVRKIPGLWTDSSGWIRLAVDVWLLHLGVENLEAILGVGNEELAMVDWVSYSGDWLDLWGNINIDHRKIASHSFEQSSLQAYLTQSR